MLTAIRGDQIQMDQIHNGHIVDSANDKFGVGIDHRKLYLHESIVASFLNPDESVHQAVLDSRLIALWDVATSQSVSGTTMDVTTKVASTAEVDTATMGGTEKGVLTTGTGTNGEGTTNYRVQLRDSSTKDVIIDELGGQIYGELTNDTIGAEGIGNYTLSFKKSDGTPYTMAVTEVSKINAVGDTLVENNATGTDTPTYTHSLNGKYFRISSPTTDFYVWYNVSGQSAIDPASDNIGRTGIAVTVAPEADATTVAAQTATVLNANAAFSVTASLTDINVTNTDAGVPLNVLSDGSGGKETSFGLQVITLGAPTMIDFMFSEIYSYLTAPYQSFITGVGFADVVGVAGSHNHHDLYYTKIEVESGQLDNRYFTKSQLDSGQLDNRYYTEAEVDPNPGSDNGDGKLDTRYYKESEISSSATGSAGAKLVGVAPTGNLSASNVQTALVELQGDIDNILSGDLDLELSMDDTYNDGSVVDVNDTNVDFQLTDTKTFKVTSDSGVTNVIKASADAAGDTVDMVADLGVTGDTTLTGKLTQASGAIVMNAGDIVDIDGTNVTIDGSAASSLATTSAPLTIETKTSGSLTVKSAGPLDLKDSNLGAAIPFSQAGVTELSTNLNTGTSVIGAINENADDLYTLIVNTLPATTDGAAGADQIGSTGVTGVIPTGGTLGSDGTVQGMLEGIARGAAGGKVFPTLGTSADGSQTGDPTGPGSFLAEKAATMYFKANEIVYIKDTNRFVMVQVGGTNTVEGTDWDYLWGAALPLAGPVFNVASDLIKMETTGSLDIDAASGITITEDAGAEISLSADGKIVVDSAAGHAVVLNSDLEVEINGGALVDVNATEVTIDGKLTATGAANDDMVITTTGTGKVELNATDSVVLAGGNVDIDAGAGKTVTIDSDTSITLTTPTVDVDATDVTVDATNIATTGLLTQTGNTQLVGDLDLDGSLDLDGTTVNIDTTGDFTVGSDNTIITSVTEITLNAPTVDVDATDVTIDATNIGTTGILTQTGDTNIIGNMNFDGDLDVDGTTATIDTTGAISLDSGDDSNFTVEAGELTLSTGTSGSVNITAADDVIVSGKVINVDGTTSVDVDAQFLNTTGILTQTGDTTIIGDLGLNGSLGVNGDTVNIDITGDAVANIGGNIDLTSTGATNIDATGGVSIDAKLNPATIFNAEASITLAADGTTDIATTGTLKIDAAGRVDVQGSEVWTEADQDGDIHLHTTGTGIVHVASESEIDLDAPIVDIHGDVFVASNKQLHVDKINITSVNPGDSATITGTRGGDLNPDNLLENAGFEAGSGIVADDWIISDAETTRSDKEQFYNAYSLRYDNVAPAIAGDVVLASQTVTGGLNDAEAYRLSIYAKGKNEAAISATLGGGTAVELVAVGTNPQNWTRYEAVITADSVNEELSIVTTNVGGEESDFSIDALFLESAEAGQSGEFEGGDYFTTSFSNLVFTVGDDDDDQIIFRSEGTATKDLLTISQNDVIISGNLTVTGDTTTINTTDLLVDDNQIILNTNVTGVPSLDAFYTVERGDEDNAQLKWNETTDKWEIYNHTTSQFETIVSSAGGDVSVSMDSAYNGGSDVTVDDTNVAYTLDTTKSFTIADGTDSAKFAVTGGTTTDSVKIATTGGIDIDATAGVTIDGALVQTGNTQIIGAIDLDGAIDHDGASFNSTVDGDFGVDADTITLDASNTNLTSNLFSLATGANADDASIKAVYGQDTNRDLFIKASDIGGNVTITGDNKVEITSNTLVDLDATNIDTTGLLTQTGNTQIVGDLDLDGSLDLDGDTVAIDTTGTAVDSVKVNSAGGIDIDAASDVTIDATNVKTTGLLTQTGDTQIVGTMDLDGSIDADGETIELTTTGTAGTHLKLVSADAASITSNGLTLEAGTGAVTIEADTASSINVTEGALTIGTTTSGTTKIASAGAVTIDDDNQTNPINFSQVNADGFSVEFAHNAQTDFDFSVRATGTEAITSVMGAINTNREDLYEIIELLSTQGAAVGTAAGSNLIGVDGIQGVMPMDENFDSTGAVGDDATLQEMLNGLATSAGGGKTFDTEGDFTAAKAAGVYFKTSEHIRILDTNRTVILLTTSAATVEGIDWDYLYSDSRAIGGAEYNVNTTASIDLATVDFDVTATTLDAVVSGAVLVDGESTITLDALSNISLQTGATLDVDAVTVDLDATTLTADLLGSFAVESNAGSSINVTGGTLDVKTTTTGDINLTSAGNIVETAIIKEENVTTFDLNASGAITLDANADSFFRNTGANINLQTIGSGEIQFKVADATLIPFSNAGSREFDFDGDAVKPVSVIEAINRAYNNTGDTSKKTYMEAPSLGSADVAAGVIQVSDEAGLFDGLASGTSDEKVDLPGGVANISVTPSQLRNTYGIFLAAYLNGLRLSDSEWVYIYEQSTGRKFISFVSNHAATVGADIDLSWSSVDAVDAITLSVTDHIVFDCTFNKSSNV